jgi:uncharacterized protein (DUF488 family)
MKTSYFARSGKLPEAVSIAGECPGSFKGRQYKKLAPKRWFYDRYQENKNETEYTWCYYSEVLRKLDPKQVFDDLGENAVLLCWEKSEEFCHRHLVAEWLSKHLNITIEEI